MEKLGKLVLDILYPPSCAGCGKFGYFLCGSCLIGTQLEAQYCIVCDKPSIKGFTHLPCLSVFTPERLLSIYKYQGSVKKLILASKFHSKTYSYLEALAELASTQITEQLGLNTLRNGASKNTSSYFNVAHFSEFQKEETQEVLIIPIPLGKWSLKKRGFNQAEKIAAVFGKKLGLTAIEDVLVKSDEHPDLALGSTRKERLVQVQNTFKVVVPNIIKNKDIILVDDVCTTGATFLEASKALKKQGARFVWCVSLAKTLLPDYLYDS